MKMSTLAIRTQRNIPDEEKALNAQLLMRAGFIYKNFSGAYSFTPLGLLVLNRIANIVREEMGTLGASEILMSTLQNPTPWEKTDRWSDQNVDVWFKTKLSGSSQEVGLGFTHEEPVTMMMTNYIKSSKDLPAYVYQIQQKFRNELRAKSGLLRGREFLMKDLYSFDKNEDEHLIFFEKVSEAYLRIFDRVGLGESTYKVYASGGSFSEYSIEFQTISDIGEDEVYLDRESRIGINKEIYSAETLKKLGLSEDRLKAVNAVEVGNIFTLGTRFSEPLGLSYNDGEGDSIDVFMGSYGIGISRLMGVIAEVLSDKKGLRWPLSVAPFAVQMLLLDSTKENLANKIYDELSKRNVSVLYDDRQKQFGEKISDAELMGAPFIILIGKNSVDTDAVEYRDRRQGVNGTISLSELINAINEK